jgi:hypothetical protein
MKMKSPILSLTSAPRLNQGAFFQGNPYATLQEYLLIDQDLAAKVRDRRSASDPNHQRIELIS